ncbi:hypothetical protein DTO96_101168 [Ephemeroptericola cinctiostellae]|uniref:Uncharacterized protein n=1 Tax=Ephemeroptericola cinctiostellae TaxID=2268024 RepID=A0A345DAP9_9BURK|nr:hypothetical protein [Ephemeroptericola cinctiostellae]AXF85437.1 hypothetical protein DTO96_101168 [Ephemeroptericola cinctiostellae]
MDLQEFVSETLLQIISGIKNAQDKTSTSGGSVNPRITGSSEYAAQHGFLRTAGGSPAQIVQFDVALTVTEGTGTKGGIGVFAGAINLGSSGQSTNENKSISRVKFAVPVSLPENQ